MTEKSKRTIWMMWVLLWPVSVVAIIVYYPSLNHYSFLDVGLMAALIIVTALSYFQVKGIDIFIIQSVSMAVFLIYGLAVEMVLVQFGIIAYLLSLRLTKEFWYRYPLNMLMFLFVSVTSAAFYYILGGQVGPLQAGQSIDWIPTMGYAFMAFFSNHIAFYLVSKACFDDAHFFGKYVQWEVITTLLTLPVSLILFILYSEFGTPAILMVAIPIITLSVIFRLINRGGTLNRLLQETNQIGRELSHTLQVERLYPLFFQSLHHMINVDAAILITVDEKGKIQSVASFNELGEETPVHPDVSLFDPIACRQKRSFLATSQKKWEPFMFHLLPEDVHSVMILPISIDQELDNLLIVANRERNKFEKPHQMIFEIMGNFFSVALDNARNYEKTKMESERDPLTNLYNYRYFTKRLDQKFEASTKTFSIIMIDLDHFKRINDVFGHENGNRVLRQVADCLSSMIGEQDIVARYGGEEFIILLDQANEETSYHFAEKLLHHLSSQRLKMDRFADTDQPHYIQVTASMGVATAPGQGEDALTLIRNADRAMYSGAKQNGRNRVAVYAR